MWKQYYEHWASMTVERLGADMLELVPALARFIPPASVIDKHVYSSWLETDLHQHLQEQGVTILIISGGETDVCILATVLGAVDLGYRVVLAKDTLCSSSDEVHDCAIDLYHQRYGFQVEPVETETILRHWSRCHMADNPVLTAWERRERRQLRREKQREANVGRAAKMHKARMTGNPDLLPHTASEISKVNIGCSGWFYWHWRGDFYPADLPTKHWFRHYAGHFRTVELNAPFYAWPTVATVQSWRRQAGQRQFVYTVKVCELITHVKRFQGTKQLVADFSFIADMLGPMMGCFLFQLPPRFHYTPARLKAILGQLDHRRRNVVEFRHASWWNETVFSAFRDTGTIFCSCSGPGLPDALIKTSKDIYVRFHGTRQWYRHDYSKQELTLWANRIGESDAERIWAYFNNDRNGYAIRNAKALRRLLQKEGNS